MPEIVAQKKFACPSCGAEAVWTPSKQALVCPYCGTVSPCKLADDGSLVHEHDLQKALQDIGDEQRGWQSEKVSVQCQSCRAISVFDPTRVGQRCEFCGSSQLIPVKQIQAPIRPESLLQFTVSEDQARDAVRKWYGSRWFAPNALKSSALTDTIHGVYIPYWTFDAQVHADWTAQSGYYYYTTESYTDGEGHTQTRQVQHTDWRPSSGQADHFFDDELVPASRGIPFVFLRKIEPFPTQKLVPYDAGYLAGWVVEQYQLDLAAAAQKSRDMMNSEMQQMCAQQVPGDTYRALEVRSDFSAQTFKQILVPVWLLSYTYGAQSFQVVINGYTGSIAGKYPHSWIKISLTVIAVLILLAIVFLWIASSR